MVTSWCTSSRKRWKLHRLILKRSYTKSEEWNDWLYFRKFLYKAFKGNVTFEEARNVCIEHNAELAVIQTAEENEFLYALLLHYNLVTEDTGPWIGFKETFTQPGSVVKYRSWVNIDDTEPQYHNFLAEQPNNRDSSMFNHSQQCVKLQINGSYNDWECEQQMPAALCKRPFRRNKRPCDFIHAGWKFYNGHFYKLFAVTPEDPRRNATEADWFCRWMGGTLAAVNNQKRNDFIANTFVGSDVERMWLGIVEPPSGGGGFVVPAGRGLTRSFVAVDHSTISYHNFSGLAQSQDEHCVSMSLNELNDRNQSMIGEWHAERCNTSLPFLCSRKAPFIPPGQLPSWEN